MADSRARSRRPMLAQTVRAMAAIVVFACAAGWPAPADAQIKAVARPGATPAWDKRLEAVVRACRAHPAGELSARLLEALRV